MNRPENACEDFVNSPEPDSTETDQAAGNKTSETHSSETDTSETDTSETYTNVFVDLIDASERPCGHDHVDPVAALECCLGGCREQEWAITYRDDAEGRWQYLGEWALIEPRVSA